MLALCWLYLAVAPLWVVIKSTQFSAGVMFFALFPISSRYPHYRLVVSPLTWLFWKIPTDGMLKLRLLVIQDRFADSSLRYLSRVGHRSPASGGSS